MRLALCWQARDVASEASGLKLNQQSSGWKSTPPLNQLTYIKPHQPTHSVPQPAGGELSHDVVPVSQCRIKRGHASTLPVMAWGGSRGEGKGMRRVARGMLMLGRQWTRTNKIVSHSFSHPLRPSSTCLSSPAKVGRRSEEELTEHTAFLVCHSDADHLYR